VKEEDIRTAVTLASAASAAPSLPGVAASDDAGAEVHKHILKVSAALLQLQISLILDIF
jgi:hypothetical protein